MTTPTTLNSSPQCRNSHRGRLAYRSQLKDGGVCGIASEKWKPIPGHPRYEASTEGRIRSVAQVLEISGRFGPQGRRVPARILTPLRHTGGYVRYVLCNNGKYSQHTGHKLVLMTFIGPRPPKYSARHLNGVRTDNRVCNLKWGTLRENQADRLAHGTSQIGFIRAKPHTPEHVVVRIRSLSKHLNNTEISRALQLPRTTVNSVLKGKRYRK